MPIRGYQYYIAECSECQVEAPRGDSQKYAWEQAEALGFIRTGTLYQKDDLILCPECQKKKRCQAEGCFVLVDPEEYFCEAHLPKIQCRFVSDEGKRCENRFREEWRRFCCECESKISQKAIQAEIWRIRKQGDWEPLPQKPRKPKKEPDLQALIRRGDMAAYEEAKEYYRKKAEEETERPEDLPVAQRLPKAARLACSRGS